MFEFVEVVIVFGRNFAPDKLPDPFYQIEVWAVWWYVLKLDAKLPGKILHNVAFLVPCIVEHQVDFFPSVFSCNLFEHSADFRRGYASVICHNKHFFGDIVKRTKDIVAPTSRKCPDITPHPAFFISGFRMVSKKSFCFSVSSFAGRRPHFSHLMPFF